MADESTVKNEAWKPKGFFGRLVSRFAQGHESKGASARSSSVKASAQELSPKSPLDLACDQFMERIESLSIDEPWEIDPAQAAQCKQARDLWSDLAKGAIKESKTSMIAAVKAGVVDESVFASQLLEALKESQGVWNDHRQASLLFGLGWEKDKDHDGYMRKINEPERWRACKLNAYGSRAPEAMADLAVFAKLMQRR